MYTPAHFEVVDRQEMSIWTFVVCLLPWHIGRPLGTGLCRATGAAAPGYKQVHAGFQPGVTTWNYTAVHAHGTATIMDAEPALRALMEIAEPAYCNQFRRAGV